VKASCGDVAQGSIVRIRSRRHTVDAIIATGPANIAKQLVRDNYIFPSEFQVHANPRIYINDVNQGPADLLEEKFMDAQEAILVGEDRVLLKMLSSAATMENDLQLWSGTLVPSVLSALQEQVIRWNLPSRQLMLSIDLLKDISTGNVFSTYFDPVSKLEIMLTGRIGTFLGQDVMTDGYRDPRLRVLGNGEVYALTNPDYVGAYTDRGPLEVEPRNNTDDSPSRGWYMYETLSMCVANARGVAKAKRI
jgi:hypothetical protein